MGAVYCQNYDCRHLYGDHAELPGDEPYRGQCSKCGCQGFIPPVIAT